MDKRLKRSIHQRLKRVINRHLNACGYESQVSAACDLQMKFERWLDDQMTHAYMMGIYKARDGTGERWVFRKGGKMFPLERTNVTVR
jgi:hypothetical protein